MSDENENDGQSPLDHLFNALGHLSRAYKQSAAEATEKRGAKKVRKLKLAFDEAPAAPKDPACCTAKRE